jgi:hypothetical protein
MGAKRPFALRDRTGASIVASSTGLCAEAQGIGIKDGVGLACASKVEP